MGTGNGPIVTQAGTGCKPKWTAGRLRPGRGQGRPIPTRRPGGPAGEPGTSRHTFFFNVPARGRVNWDGMADRLTRRDWLALSVGSAAGLAFGLPLHGQDRELKLEKLRAPGPAWNRVNFVFLAEGFASGSLGTFEAVVHDLSSRLERHEIFREYRNFLNFYTIPAASKKDWDGTGEGTRFGVKMGRNNLDLDVDWRRVYAGLPRGMPEKHVLVLIVHRSEAARAKGGGTDTRGRLATGSSWPVFLHELGHALGLLGDEYPDGGPIGKASVNVSTSADRIPWKPMLDRRGVGIRRVDGLRRTLWKGEERCLMAQSAADFGPVCRWGMVLGIHRHTRLLESVQPAEGRISGGEVRARLLSPNGHDLLTRIVYRPAEGVDVSSLTPERIDAEALTRRHGWRELRVDRRGGEISARTPRGKNVVVAFAEDRHEWIAADPGGVARDVRIWITG